MAESDSVKPVVGHLLISDFRNCAPIPRVIRSAPMTPVRTVKKSKVTVTTLACTCSRCGYRWTAHRKGAGDLPVRCASCRTPLWNTPRVGRWPAKKPGQK